MDATVRHEAHEVNAAAVASACSNADRSLRSRRTAGPSSSSGGFAPRAGDTSLKRVSLLDDAPCADVEVSNLAVSHLPVGESDVSSRDLKRPVRAVSAAVEVRRLGGGDGIPVVVVRDSGPTRPR